MIYKVANSLREFVEKHGRLIILWEHGEPKTLDDIVGEAVETGSPIGIGMLPRGDFKHSTLSKAFRRYSLLGGTPLKSWTIILEIVCSAERILGLKI